MFDVQFCLHDDIVVMKSIKYTKKWIKKVLVGLLAFDVGLAGFSLAALILHFVTGIPLFLPIILATCALISIPCFVTTYEDIKAFSLEFGEQGLCFKCRKTELNINYKDLTVCGLIKRAGSQSWSSLVTDSHTDETAQKSIFVFTANPNPNLRKIVYHMRTSTGICHGHKKGVCCVSDWQGSPIFTKLFEVTEHYCSDYSVEIINKDRKELKKNKRQETENFLN